MASFEDITKIFGFNLEKKYCIEILFSISDNLKFNNCWMGKMTDKKTNQDIYWFGLTKDGKNAYDYESFEKMSEAKVFDEKSLKEIWGNVELDSIDGCDPEERIACYIK